MLARYARNRRLGDAIHPVGVLRADELTRARTYYDALRTRIIDHPAALRQLGNRLVGIQAQLSEDPNPNPTEPDDETTAWAHHNTAAHMITSPTAIRCTAS